jgi:AraC family transcriptional regulator, regulatory protein of adaptative response / methylated-DNA-[protein]-cysteine methyltransferase
MRAVYERDPSFEGIFFTGVRTTGIFCRPTCPAKKPTCENIEFFATPTEAMLSGYRACLRCRPMDLNRRAGELIERLCAEVERAPGGRITEKELAALAIDPSTARRQFKRHYGMTFQAYHRARRMGLALREVRHGSSVTQAKAGSGFESASGFREAFIRISESPQFWQRRVSPCSWSVSKLDWGRWLPLLVMPVCTSWNLLTAAL